MLKHLFALSCLTLGPTAAAQDAPRILNTLTSHWRVSLPSAYQRELDRVAPGIATYSDDRYMEHFHVDSLMSASIIILDLNGDKRPEVFLFGSLGDSAFVVSLITSPAGVTGSILHRRAVDPLANGYVSEKFSIEKERGRTWIRWQDEDCKGEGWEFRVVGQVTTTRKSKCYYGE
jgi:hypothetical protein